MASNRPLRRTRVAAVVRRVLGSAAIAAAILLPGNVASSSATLSADGSGPCGWQPSGYVCDTECYWQPSGYVCEPVVSLCAPEHKGDKESSELKVCLRGREAPTGWQPSGEPAEGSGTEV
jgi:hypothetical protein